MTKDQLQYFADFLIKERHRLKLTRKAFAALVGISRATHRSHEKAVQHPTQDMLDKYSAALHKPIAMLIGGPLPIDPSNPLLVDLNDEDLEQAQAFHHAPMTVKQKVLGVLQERSTFARQRLTPDQRALLETWEAMAPADRQVAWNILQALAEKRRTDNPGLTVKAVTPEPVPQLARDRKKKTSA